MLTANLRPATRIAMITVVASLFLHAGLAHADDVTFTADGLFSTDVLGYATLESPGGRLDGLGLYLALNTFTPDFFQLSTTGKIFDGTLIDSRPTEIVDFEFSGASVTQFIGNSPTRAFATVNFANSSVTISPPRMQAPEIDPASTVSSLFLLAGGLAVLRGRRTGVLQAATAPSAGLVVRCGR